MTNNINDRSTVLAHTDRGSGILTPVDTPAPDLTVPPRLRAAYSEAPTLPDRDLIEFANRALQLRADRAMEAAHAAYQRRHGRGFIDSSDSIRRPIIAAGLTAEDFDHAQHLQRLDAAERKVSAAERAAEAEAKRQAAKCRACGALDVPTRLPIVAVTIDAPTRALVAASPGSTVTLDGGPVCAPCEATIGQQYRASLAGQSVGKRRTRTDAAREYLTSLPVAGR